MRKTPKLNPKGFEKNSWNYRCLQLRRALGWSQHRLAKIMGISRDVIYDLEMGIVTRPDIATIRALKSIESAYYDVLKTYKKAPVRMCRLGKAEKGRVQLLPITIRRPEDIDALEDVGANSNPLFFGRGSRSRMQQTGMSLRKKEYLIRRGKAIARAYANKTAKRRSELPDSDAE